MLKWIMWLLAGWVSVLPLYLTARDVDATNRHLPSAELRFLTGYFVPRITLGLSGALLQSWVILLGVKLV